jgi:hypothetical protein
MKITKIIIVVIVLLLMIAATSLDYFFKHSLVGGSIDSMENIVTVPVIFPTVLIMIFFWLLYWYFKSPNNIKLVSLLICIFLWVSSGRMISIITWPDGRVNTGWFNIPTNQFYLCNPQADCETTVSYKTKTENLFFWRIRVKNENIDKVVFVGPFLWNKTLRLFSDKFNSGKYTKK